MNNLISYIDYQKLSPSEKLDFFDGEIASVINSMKDNELNNFLRRIILDNSENSYVRKSAQKIFIECVFLKKIKVWQALSLLVGDWNDTAEIFLEMQRVKDLYFFYDEEPDEIERIFSLYLEHDELEIASEAYLNLGLVNMQKSFIAETENEIFDYLDKSKNYLKQADKLIENRIDAQFYEIVVSIINDAVRGIKGDFKRQLDNLAILLYKKEVYSFDFKVNSFDLGFYRALYSLFSIEQEMPNKWLDYRHGFSKLHTEYAEIKNQQIKERLNESVVSSAFISMLDDKFIEPYFALNYNSQISKINDYLDEQEPNSEIYNFLVRVKTLAQDNDFKKKVETASIRESFLKMFPDRNPTTIDNTLQKIDISISLDLLYALEELIELSIDDFLDKLFLSSVKLQGNRVYRGNFSEDDRNTYISDLLDGGNYMTKDQTRWSKSAAGRSAGEIDIMVKDKKAFPYAIIEALNLKSLDTAYIITHIDKIFTYDTTGFNYNFILVYANVKNFGKFWKNYIDFVSKHNYKYKFELIEDVKAYNYADIKLAKAKHIRNEKEVFLYHLGINLFE